MTVEDYLAAVETLGLAAGDHSFVTADPLAYELATRLAQLASEFRDRERQRKRRDPHGKPARKAEEPRHRVR